MIGSSKEPGTQAISNCLLDSDTSMPWRDKQSMHPLKSLLVMRSLNLAITIATLKEEEFTKEPSIVALF